VMVYACGPVSGGHLNPAVTMAMWKQKKIEFKDAIKYMIAQCAGGAAAGLASGFMYGFQNAALIGPSDSEKFWLGAPLVEFCYTFMLCFVVLNVCEGTGKDYYGIAIGFVVIAGGYGGGPVSGGAFNPAVALGVNFMGVSAKSLWLPVYVAVQLAAGFVASTALHLVRPETITADDESWKIVKFLAVVEKKFDPEDTSEFLGTFFLSLTVTLNALVPNNPGSVWSIAASLMCMIYALGDVSGGVFNPALTIAYLVRWNGTGLSFGVEKLCDPKISPKEGLKYFIAQVLGGAGGAGMTFLIYLFSGNEWPISPVQPKGDFTLSQAFFAEFFGTFVLCYVVLAMVSSTTKPQKDYAAFAIGGAVIAGGYAFGSLSGGILNPAITIANSMIYKLELITRLDPAVFFFGELTGGISAAIVFRYLTHAHEFEGGVVDTGASVEAPLLEDEAN